VIGKKLIADEDLYKKIFDLVFAAHKDVMDADDDGEDLESEDSRDDDSEESDEEFVPEKRKRRKLSEDSDE
jgi:hypothetical protein